MEVDDDQTFQNDCLYSDSERDRDFSPLNEINIKVYSDFQQKSDCRNRLTTKRRSPDKCLSDEHSVNVAIHENPQITLKRVKQEDNNSNRLSTLKHAKFPTNKAHRRSLTSSSINYQNSVSKQDLHSEDNFSQSSSQDLLKNQKNIVESQDKMYNPSVNIECQKKSFFSQNRMKRKRKRCFN